MLDDLGGPYIWETSIAKASCWDHHQSLGAQPPLLVGNPREESTVPKLETSPRTERAPHDFWIWLWTFSIGDINMCIAGVKNCAKSMETKWDKWVNPGFETTSWRWAEAQRSRVAPGRASCLVRKLSLGSWKNRVNVYAWRSRNDVDLVRCFRQKPRHLMPTHIS